jgi:transposase-like protein
VPKPYPAEFRRRALDLVASGRTVREVAAMLDIAESCLYGWKSRDLIDRGLKPGITSSESAELAAAHRRIRDLEEEVKILRKAAVAVEQVVPPKGRFQLVAELVDDGVQAVRACRELGCVSVGVLPVADPGAIVQDGSARVAHRPDCCDPRGFARHLRRSTGPRGTGPCPGCGGRVQTPSAC